MPQKMSLVCHETFRSRAADANGCLTSPTFVFLNLGMTTKMAIQNYMLARVFFSITLLVTSFVSPSAGQSKCEAVIKRDGSASYCESVPFGLTPNANKQPVKAPVSNNQVFEVSVSIESKFFEGLQRLSTSRGMEFRKGGQSVTNYPDTFVIEVEPFFLQLKNDQSELPPSATKLPQDKTPTRVILRWLDPQTGAVLDNNELKLEEVVEAWQELSPPKVWYRARVEGVEKPLAAKLQIIVLGNSETPLATLSGRL